MVNPHLESQIDEAFSPTADEVFVAPAPLSPLSPVFNQSAKFQKYKKFIYGMMIAMIVLVIGGVGVFAYLSNNPEKVVQKMMERFVAVKTMEYSGKITSKTSTTEEADLSTTTLEFSGSSDITDPAHVKGQLSLEAVSNLVTPEDVQLALELRFIDSILYAQLKQAPENLFLPVTDILNEWVKIDPAVILPDSTTEQSPYTVNEEQKERITDILASAHLLKITEKLPDETVHGVSTFHFGYEVDEAALKQAAVAIAQVNSEEEYTAEDIVKLQKSMDEMLSELTFSDGEIWIGKQDLLPHKFKIAIVFARKSSLPKLENVTFELEMKNFNQPVTVEVPADPILFEEVMQSLGGENYGAFGGMGSLESSESFDPVEQRNIGKDTGSRSDAEELVAGVERFQAFNAYVPWNTSGGISTQLAWMKVSKDTPWTDGGNPNCSVLQKLSTATVPECFSSYELKESFVQRILQLGENSLYLYNRGQAGDATYGCFKPLSDRFREEARTHCKDESGSGLPNDIEPSVRATICAGYTNSATPLFSCIN